MLKPTVYLSRDGSGTKSLILIRFEYSRELAGIVRELGGRWRPDKKAWGVAWSKEKIAEIHRRLPHCKRVEAVNLRREEEAVRPASGRGSNPKAIQAKTFRAKTFRVEAIKTERKRGSKTLCSADKARLHEFVRYLRGKRFSESTVRTYYTHVLDFMIFLEGKELKEVGNRDVERFVEEVCVKRHYAISTHRQVISALKHFSTLFSECRIDELELMRPSRSKMLPEVLSQPEVISLLQNTRNIKHRAVLGLLYSSGLRIGELLDLKLADIDVQRRQVFVRSGKGRKDRYVVLAESFGQLLSNYLMSYQPQVYFVEGKEPGSPYSATSVRSFLRNSCRAAGIRKHVTPHTLRHSYATHLLEQGVDIRYIQELLGHSRPETTMVYTHVTHRDILNIASPLDTLVKKMQLPHTESKNPPLSLDNL